VGAGRGAGSTAASSPEIRQSADTINPMIRPGGLGVPAAVVPSMPPVVGLYKLNPVDP
jgi:hypothetical protein